MKWLVCWSCFAMACSCSWGHAFAQGVICRAFRIVNHAREHLEAKEFIAEDVYTLDEIQLYATMTDNGDVYLHSNVRSQARDDTIIELNRDPATIPNDKRELHDVLRASYVRQAGTWHFDHPTKIVFNPKDDELVMYLIKLVYADLDRLKRQDGEVARFSDAVLGKVKMFVNPKCRSCDVVSVLEKLENSQVAEVDALSVGVITERQIIRGWDEEHSRAQRYLGELTTKLDEAVFYCSVKNQTLYIESNYRPIEAGGERAAFAAKIASRYERSLEFLIGAMLDDRSDKADDVANIEFDVWNNFRFIVERSVGREVEFGGHPRVTEVSSP